MSELAAIYTRISKHNDRVPKVQEQETLCRKLAKSADYDVVTVYTDDGISASKFLDRPGWNQMLADVQAGKFNVLLAQSDDRLTRQTMEKEMLALACASAGVKWHTVNEGLIDPATAEGGLRSGLNTLLAVYETRRKSERQRQANDAIRAKGLPLPGGERPFGWEADKATLRESESDLIVQAYTDYISAKATLSGIRTAWNKAGVLTTRGNPWDIAKVEKVLRRPRNVRYVLSRGAVLKDEHGKPLRGEWKAIVDDDTYQAALVLLDDPKRKMTKVYEPKWVLASLAKCGSCGGTLRSSTRNNEKVYRCAVHDGQGHKEAGVRHVSIRCHVIEPIVTEHVVSALLMTPTDDGTDPDTTTLSALHVRMGALREERARLVQSVRKGLLEDDDVATEITDIRLEVSTIEQRIADIKRTNAKAALMTEARMALWGGKSVNLNDAAEVKSQIREGFEALDLQQKRALIKGLLDITVENGRTNARIKISHKVATGLNETPHDDSEFRIVA